MTTMVSRVDPSEETRDVNLAAYPLRIHTQYHADLVYQP